MVVTCAWCGRQIIEQHDCNERRAALAEGDELHSIPTVAEVLHEDDGEDTE